MTKKNITKLSIDAYIAILLGTENTHLTQLSKALYKSYAQQSSTPMGSKDYIKIEQHTLWFFMVLYTMLYFEKEHKTLFTKEKYAQFSILRCVEEKSHIPLGERIYTLYKNIEKNYTLPLLPFHFLADIHACTLSHITAIPNTLLVEFLKHIHITMQEHSAHLYSNIAGIYEVLLQYTLYCDGDTFLWYNSSLNKKHSGIYYTPHSLTKKMVEYLFTHLIPYNNTSTSPENIWSIIDYCCGSGAFIIEALTQATAIIEKNLSASIKKTIQKEYISIERYILSTMLYGIDIHPLAISVLHYLLQEKTFIEDIPCVQPKNFLCGNALVGFSYSKAYKVYARNGLGTEKNLLKKIYSEYIQAVTRNNISLQAELLPKLQQLYSTALSIYIASTSDYSVEELYNTCHKEYLHYELVFPHIFLKKPYAFTIALGNPPWEKTKFEEKLFIEQLYKGYTTKTEEEKKRIRIHSQKKYSVYKNSIEKTIALRTAGYKALYTQSKGIGDDNIYRYCIEKALCSSVTKPLLAKHGIMFYIIPTAFITEESASSLRKYCLQNYILRYYVGFENRNTIFKHVDSRYKFSIIAIQKTMPTTYMLPFASLQICTQSLHEYPQYQLPLEEAILFSRGTYAIPELQSTTDARILHKLYLQHPALQEKYITVRRELDCFSNRELFYDTQSDYANLPLYQGAMIWQYRNAYSGAKLYTSSHIVDSLMESREIYRLYNDIYHCLPQSFIQKYPSIGKAEAVCAYTGIERAEMLLEYIPERTLPRFALRAIARNTDERSVIASLLPYGVVYQNSLFGSVAKSYILGENSSIICIPTPIERQLYAIAVYNSLVYDWCMRFISSINISKAYIHKIPFPQPADTLLIQEPYANIIKNTLLLHHYYNAHGVEHITSLPQYASLFTQKTILKNDEEAKTCKAHNDCLVAQLYNLSYAELEHITSRTHFAVLHNKDIQYIQRLLDMYRTL